MLTFPNPEHFDWQPQRGLNETINEIHERADTEAVVNAVASRWLAASNRNATQLSLEEFKRELTRALQLQGLPRPLMRTVSSIADTDRHPLAVS